MSTSINSTTPMSDKTIALLESIAGAKLTLGNLIHSIRLCEEISQTDFAKFIGVSRQYLCDVENGRRVVSPRLAAEWAEKLGYLPVQFVRLALLDELKKAGLHFDVELKEAA